MNIYLPALHDRKRAKDAVATIRIKVVLLISAENYTEVCIGIFCIEYTYSILFEIM